ncbi:MULTISPECIES: hypothetical protein [Streptomyces]|uniref:hypothetical protein n=1 Tax=Streptomyces TaxID=1883 RepID=UPI000AC5F01B|nr:MULTISPECIES: hypothetical protein [Streptomyces]
MNPAEPAAPETPTGTTPTGTTPDTATRPRRRVLRTVRLIAVAAVLGLVGGTAVGYRIQADREPTPLPALNQPGLAYPAKPLPEGQEPEPLSAKEDLQSKAQGDLRKLLVPRPAGAKADGEDGWVSLSTYVSDYTWPNHALQFQLRQGIRRIASRSWRSGEYRTVTVNLIQYRPGEQIGALEFVEDQLSYAEDESGAAGEELKGSGNGRYFVYPVHREAGYLDIYEARAFAQRGDVAIEIFMFDTRKIAEKDVRSLAEKQLERL